MAVETTTRKSTQTMTSLLTEFAFTFRALTSTPEDIKCIRTNTAASTNEDMEYVADLPEDPTEADVLKYTVEINDDGIGGTVEVAWASTGSTITIYRETTDTQASDYEDYNQFPASTVETDFDKRTLVSQEVKEDTDRTLKLAITSTLSNITLPESEPNKIFGWDSAGTAIENKVAVNPDDASNAASSATVALSAQTAASSHATTALAAAEAAELVLGWTVATIAQAIAGTNNTTVMSPYMVRESTKAYLGAKTLYVGAATTYTTITLAMAAATYGTTILVEEGTYTETIVFSQDNITLKALGSKSNTIITGISGTTAVSFATKSGCVVDGFTINQTSPDGATDYCVYSNNDDATDYNYLWNCDLLWQSASAYNDHSALYVADGNFEVKNCKITTDSNYTGTDNNSSKCINLQQSSPCVMNIFNCDLINDSESTGSSGTTAYAIIPNGTLTTYIFDCKITVDGAQSTTGETGGINCTGAGTTHIRNNLVTLNCSGTGEAYGLTATASHTVNSYNNIINATNADNDAYWARSANSGVFNTYGDIVVAGDLTDSATVNGFVFPVADGTNGQHIVTSGASTTLWATP